MLILLLTLAGQGAVYAQTQSLGDERLEALSQSVVIVKALRTNKSYHMGTGFVVSGDGLIATNFHVVVEAESIEIETKDGKVYPVELIANYDDTLDLFVLKVHTDGLPALALGDSDHLRAQEEVFLIGHTKTKEFQRYHGKYVGHKDAKADSLLVFEIPSELGNSGGPIFNGQGEVVGILVQGRLDIDGFGYGIPINEAKNFFNYDHLSSPQAFIEGVSQPFKLTYLGDGELISKKYEQALEYYRKALSFDPDYFKAHLGQARAYSEQMNIPQAIEEWHYVLGREPDHAEANLYMGKYYFSRGSFEEAIAYMEKATAAAPQSVHVYNDLGIAFGEIGDPERAIEYYKKAVAVDSQYATGYFNLSAAYYNKKDLKAAKEYCRLAQKNGYNVPASFLSLLGIK